MSNENLEIQYTPSNFTKRFPDRLELINHFCEFANKESNKSRNEFECHLNISYGKGERQKIDIYGVGLPLNAPTFIFIHGGYWQEMDKNNSAFLVQPFVKQGIRCLVMGYDLCPQVTLKAITEQIAEGFEWIADYVIKNDVKRLCFAGHSAGAHLLTFGLSEKFLSKIPKDVTIDALFISGIYYFDELRHLKAANDKNILSINDENVLELSPHYKNYGFLKKYRVRVHIFAGLQESETFMLHSKKFAEGPMKEYIANFNFLDVDHFDIVEKFTTDENYALTKLIIEILK